MIARLANNPFEAQKLYSEFLESVHDPKDPRQRVFVDAVENNRFHLLRKLERDRRGGWARPNADKTWEEQVTWNMQVIRIGLRSFLESPGIKERFAAPGIIGLDIEEDVRQGRIILLRFDARTGKIGQTLTRMMLAGCYGAVLRTTMEQRGGRLFPAILDELQEYADFSDSPGSEKHFAALAREFGGVLLAGAQSVAALACKVESPLPVKSFLANCNNRLSFYSHELGHAGACIPLQSTVQAEQAQARPALRRGL